MNFDASLLVIMGIFWITYLILRFFFFQPMFELLAARERSIETARLSFEAAVAETNQAVEAEEARLVEARATSAAKRERMRREALEQRQQSLVEAKAAARQQLEEAQARLDEQLLHERAVLERYAEKIAGTMAERLLGRAV